MRPLLLHPDRFFDPDPSIRSVARRLYEGARALPLVCPHGHVDAALLADDNPFPEPVSLLLTPDHYLLRMLYSSGVPMQELLQNPDPREVWRAFAERYFLFLGTPSRAWMDHVLHEVFGVRQSLDADSADAVYDHVSERLIEPFFRPRALFERANIEVLTTTDAATDSLEHHAALRVSGWTGRVIPCFRPDALFQIADAGWKEAIAHLQAATNSDIGDLHAFLRALEDRRAFFRSMGATATDHGVETPHTELMEGREAESIFARALAGTATATDQRRFEAHMLMEMARMSTEDGMVMQLHAGSLRNHNLQLFDQFGPDRGGDIPVAVDFTRGLRALLGEFGNEAAFRLVVFTLDESTYARELAPMAGHYPAMRLGPPWWFHDSIEGMKRYRESVTETAGIYNTAGFNDDTRAFLSIPARHDLARRLDANWLAGLVARHQVEEEDAARMMRALSYDLAKETYRLG